jgi:hypothetical protein
MSRLLLRRLNKGRSIELRFKDIRKNQFVRREVFGMQINSTRLETLESVRDIYGDSITRITLQRNGATDKNKDNEPSTSFSHLFFLIRNNERELWSTLIFPA